ncbi:MAG: polyribonucleotide nucleotidyltransferase [Candidatus Harrisonbacteria bacterium CG10_big_fil_rev_8_21_14_0_10_45_28]|uniref:Polyribonucleotide nucleotidyltransferase n=1 Tax=Candidatus Harrisonbacteria bacterium CG10_big_fil_rev_8_21_14_0_10_45_28 TaxID=1974586 RepID=A0A2H0UPA8_9BACT|nr:MAG: polyribonucleotide nucleotidyltransferase [Candidatus Harrisonbacteria bacterium CG10_big_fil_rev_8_21_14_0_10_45_28]
MGLINRKQFSLDYAGKTLTLEVSELAGQASAAVFGRYGDSEVLATVVLGKKDSDWNYFPLSVNYEERFYAVGKILGSRFVRREGRPSDEAVLSGRAIDRVIRPLFDHRIRKEIQLVLTILSLDEEDDLDFLALMTASAAISISQIPWNGPAAGVRLAKVGDEYIVNPVNSKVSEFEFDTFVAGTKNKINMIELEGIEAQEGNVLKAFETAQAEINKLVEFIEGMAKEIGKEKVVIEIVNIDEALQEKIESFVKGKLEEAIYITDKEERDEALEAIHLNLDAHLKELGFSEEQFGHIGHVMDEIINEIVHRNVLESDKRPDGRKSDEIRPLYGEVALLKKTHGSAMFMRGQTQALAVTTLGAPGDEQLVESMSVSAKDRFLLHYNFPPYSVGEVGMFRGAGRREIGHGALAKKALKNMLPSKDIFPYTLRVVSEILSSNGSSSMATVCASTLSMMDAGVPLKKPVAGIAMGLITGKDGEFKVLTDIQGYEDHHGDADFKVAGTDSGVTAIQMDVKNDGFDLKMLTDGLEKAKIARLKILEVMKGVLPEPRAELSPLAPLICSLKINPEMIGLVIGPGGKTINEIIDRTGVMSIDIDDDGTVFVSGVGKEKVDAALGEVRSLTKEYEVGEIVEGEIVKMLEFGAIVQIDSKHDGMIHVSELKDGFVKNVEDVVKLGDKVKAKVIKAENGKIGLSLKAMGNQK